MAMFSKILRSPLISFISFEKRPSDNARHTYTLITVPRRHFVEQSRKYFPSIMRFRSLTLVALGAVVSLGGIVVLKQRFSRVSCEIDTSSQGEPKHFHRAIQQKTLLLRSAIQEAHAYLQQVKEETGVPGLVVAVSVDGKLVWSEGMGFADVENHVHCNPDTVMRIASISKPLTTLAVAKLYEEKKLDVDIPVQQYVPTFPLKHFNGKPVMITTRQLMSHLGGIRHYSKFTSQPEKLDKSTDTQKTNDPAKTIGNEENTEKVKEKKEQLDGSKSPEFYIKEPKTMEESLAIFQDDPLTGEPGENYLYTSYGYTLISAVVESAAKQDFLSYMKTIFRQMGMDNTEPEMNDKITYNRARYYDRGAKNALINTPYVDNSYKWAGGGFVSSVKDLIKFGNTMLYACQVKDYTGDDVLPGIVKPETIEEMFKKVDKTAGIAHKDGWYGWGWFVLPEKQSHGACRKQKKTIYHTGSAVGAVSILLLRPENCINASTIPPKGIVVSIIMNLQTVSKSILVTAGHVADIFEKNLHSDLCGITQD